jgi:hypothetical protein
MGICSTEQGFMTRITDKMSRLSSFLNSGKMHVEDESFRDTIVDVINYMVLLSAYIQDKDEETQSENSKLESKLELLMEERNHESMRDNGF